MGAGSNPLRLEGWNLFFPSLNNINWERKTETHCLLIKPGVLENVWIPLQLFRWTSTGSTKKKRICRTAKLQGYALHPLESRFFFLNRFFYSTWLQKGWVVFNCNDSAECWSEAWCSESLESRWFSEESCMVSCQHSALTGWRRCLPCTQKSLFYPKTIFRTGAEY